jgi:hypothetical protein
MTVEATDVDGDTSVQVQPPGITVTELPNGVNLQIDRLAGHWPFRERPGQPLKIEVVNPSGQER